MADAKHTLGPWRVSEQCAQMIDIRHDNNEAGAISQTLAKVVARPSWQQVAEANARLIAAAPELLEALERANRVLAELVHSSAIPGDDFAACDTRQRVRFAYESAYAVIVKATGAAQ